MNINDLDIKHVSFKCKSRYVVSPKNSPKMWLSKAFFFEIRFFSQEKVLSLQSITGIWALVEAAGVTFVG